MSDYANIHGVLTGEMESHQASERALTALKLMRDERESLQERVAFLVAEAHDWQPKLEAAFAERDELLRGRTAKYPNGEGGGGKEETYWLRGKSQASIIHLRDIEDYYRTQVGGEYAEGSFCDVRATRARQLYEAISADLKNGSMARPSQAEALEAALARVAALEEALREDMTAILQLIEYEYRVKDHSPVLVINTIEQIARAALVDAGKET